MWTVVYMTQSEKNANRVAELLSENNLIYKVRPVGNSDEEDGCYEVLVPDTEINEAHGIIIDNNLM